MTGTVDLPAGPARGGRPPSHASGIAHRPDLDGIRAVAVGLVVLFHAGTPYLHGGFVGVDVFFVLSGFLITGLLYDELGRTATLSLVGFYGRRARRLLPMAGLVLLVTAVAFRFVLSPLAFSSLTADIRAAMLYFANWHFAAGAVDYMSTTDRSPVLHYWSLSVEEQFYLCWPLLMWAAYRYGRRSLLVVVAVVTAVSFAVSARMLFTSSSPWDYYGLHTRAWELGIGALCALSYVRLNRIPAAAGRWLGWAGTGAVVASGFVIGRATTFPGVAAALPVLGTAALIAAGSGAAQGAVTRLLSTAPMTYVGRISYSWYLWHWPVLVFVGAVVQGVELTRLGVTPGPATGWPALLALAISFVLSAVSHRVLENPVRRSRGLARRPRRSIALAGGITAIVLLGTGAVLQGGSAGPHELSGLVVRTQPGPPTAVLARVDLTMTPQQAHDDVPQTGSCYASQTSTDAPTDCQFGDADGSRTVVLVGDSHAQQLVPAFEQAARAGGWQLWIWAKSACPFVDIPVQLPQFDRTYPTCAPWRQAVLARIAALGHVDVLVSAHFAGAIEDLTRYPMADGSTATTPDDILPTWAAAWRRTVAAVSPYVRNIVSVHDTPFAHLDVPSCLAIQTETASACEFDRAAGLRDADAVLTAELRTRRTETIDLDRFVCPGQTCPVLWQDGSIIYRDDRHLSGTVVAKLGAPVARALQHVMDTTAGRPGRKARPGAGPGP